MSWCADFEFRVTQDSNKPKFLTDDITLFKGIMSDVFSGTTEPVRENGHSFSLPFRVRCCSLPFSA